VGEKRANAVLERELVLQSILVGSYKLVNSIDVYATQEFS
jgi:hypothetical protein